ncbi:MAG: NACHT domain-containing protein [Prochlorothrix sp.]|nr:NACHT domain-containing protein [Prochlorothrix sp.]
MATGPQDDENLQDGFGPEAVDRVGEPEELLDLEDPAGKENELLPDEEAEGAATPELKPTSEAQFVRRGTRKVGQFLIQWSPLGATGGVMLSSLIQQQWFQAALTFPILAVTTAWAAYTEGFLARLEEVMKVRGGEDVDRLGHGINRLWQGLQETMRWQLAGFESQYLECQAAACRDYEVEGVQSAIFKPQLAEVFVPPKLSALFVRGRDGGNLPMLPGLGRSEAELRRLSEREGLSIWDLLRRVDKVPAYGQMVIMAWGGYGKTTLLRHLTFIYSQKQQGKYKAPKLVPFLLYLRDWQQVLGEKTGKDAPDLAKLITQGHLRKLPGGEKLAPPPNWAANLLGSGGALVMLDGFDEVQERNRPQLSRWIGAQMRAYPKAIFLLTSRPNAYNQDYKGTPPTTSLFVEPFNRSQQRAFVNQWYLCQERYARGGRDTLEVAHAAETSAQALLDQLEQRPDLGDLARNPLLLNLIATFHRYYPGEELPQRKGELYQEIVKLQLGARPLAKRIQMPLEWEESQEVLQGLALAMVRKEWRTVRRGAVVPFLEQRLRGLNVAVSAEAFLKAVVQVSELLVEREAQEYEFAHLSFQSYLAALEIQRTRQEKLLLENYATPFWKETILLYGSQSRNPESLIQGLCSQNPEGIISKSAIDLAYSILQETHRQLDSTVTDQVESLRFAASQIESLRSQVQDLID